MSAFFLGLGVFVGIMASMMLALAVIPPMGNTEKGIAGLSILALMFALSLIGASLVVRSLG